MRAFCNPGGKKEKKEGKKDEKASEADQRSQVVAAAFKESGGARACAGAASQVLPPEDRGRGVYFPPCSSQKPFRLLLTTMSYNGKISSLFLWSKVMIFFKIDFHRSFLLA